jgi:hypothetical protein
MGYSPFRPLGVTHYQPSEAYHGFTLFNTIGDSIVYLIDMQGRVVHTWRLPYATFYSYLLDDGRLLASARPGEPTVRFGGWQGGIFELEWDGRVRWEHVDPAMHHDHCRLQNGNTMILRWVPVPPELEREVGGGAPDCDRGKPMWTDELQEVTPAGEVVWSWRCTDWLDPRVDAIGPIDHREEWTHCNTVEEFKNGDIAVSFRRLDTVALIDRASGRFRWKWGRGELGHQHDPTELANGNVLIFDNGIQRPDGFDRSRVVEVDPRTGQIVWQFVGQPEASFYSRNISGAQRLPNGNTLVCEGDCGRLFEVTPNHDIVWEYQNPFFFRDPAVGNNNRVFRAHRYGPDHPALHGKPLDPTSQSWRNQAFDLR